MKWRQLSQIKENKKSFETSFKPMWHETKTCSYLELLSLSNWNVGNILLNFFFLFATYYHIRIKEFQNKIIELRNENEQKRTGRWQMFFRIGV